MDNRRGLPEILRNLADGRADQRPDGVLLRRFVDSGDADAFAALVRRHGPLVWGVCRRVLRRRHDAEDAFQATFLLLARFAGSIRRGTSLRSWLYGVALRAAVRVRSRVERRCELPETDQLARPEDPADAAARAEQTAVLDEEIRRLPEHYRLPLVLCYLLGRTNDEAAGELGCPRGTIAVRLARAREQLRRRLARRGLGPLAALPVLPAADVLPARLVSSTRTAVSLSVAGHPVDSPAFTLANGVWTSMFFDKCKKSLLFLLAAALVGGAVTGGRALLAQPPAPGIPLPAAAAPEKKQELTRAQRGARIQELMVERQAAAKVAYQAFEEQFTAGRGDLYVLFASAERLLRSELEMATARERRIAIREEQVARMKGILDINSARYETGRCSLQDQKSSRFFYLDACIELEREKAM
jgi:RNA polymerase sigma factor (sigma-70 family)